MIVPLYDNIASMLGKYLAAPGVLVSERVGVNASGQRVLYQTYRLSSGALQERAVPVKAEHRPIVQPGIPVSNPVESAPPPVVERVDRRSVDRGDRDPRMPLTAADRAKLVVGERRTGSPLQSVFQEVKSMLLTPSGMVVAGLIVVGGVAVLLRR